MTACVLGCHRTGTDGRQIPVHAADPGLVCRDCADRMGDWLADIPGTYALLPDVVEPGTVDTNPETTSTRNPEAPAPVRLDVLDLLDDRRGWQDGRPSDNRRGVLGVLQDWAQLVRDGRGLPRPDEPPAAVAGDSDEMPTVHDEARFLARHLPWCCEQTWVGDLHDDLRRLQRDLANAVGEYRPRPVGSCPRDVERDGQTVTCGGPLLQSRWNPGVFCAACRDTWGHDELRRLGLVLGEDRAS